MSIVALGALAACNNPKSGPPAPPSAAPPAKDADVSETARAETSEARPVYPTEGVKPDPLAERLCAALHTLPAKRRAECCQRTPPAEDRLAAECVRMLSAALGDGAVKLAPAGVDRCVAALDLQHQGCDWVGRLSPLPPAACGGLAEGTLGDGARCRSNLECKAPLRCLGLGPTQPGKCGAALPEGATCGTGGDALGSFLRDPTLDRAHPECAGYCAQNRCRASLKAADACVADMQCAPGLVCAAGHCAAVEPAAVGAPCQGPCVEGARCVAARCLVPKAAGEPCASDLECRAACLPNPAGKGGTCGAYCATTYVAPPK
jgi:hypothetical protein